MRYGGAKKGDRTLVDALVPAAEAMETELKSSGGGSAKKVAEAGATAASSGADATAAMKEAAMGRASYVDRSRLVDADPGARAVAEWMAVIADNL